MRGEVGDDEAGVADADRGYLRAGIGHLAERGRTAAERRLWMENALAAKAKAPTAAPTPPTAAPTPPTAAPTAVGAAAPTDYLPEAVPIPDDRRAGEDARGVENVGASDSGSGSDSDYV